MVVPRNGKCSALEITNSGRVLIDDFMHLSSGSSPCCSTTPPRPHYLVALSQNGVAGKPF